LRRAATLGATEMAKRFHNPALADAAGAQAYVETPLRIHLACDHELREPCAEPQRAQLDRAAGRVATRRAYIFSVSPERGCHFISRCSTTPTALSSTSAKAVSTRMPAITVLMSKTISAWWIR